MPSVANNSLMSRAFHANNNPVNTSTRSEQSSLHVRSALLRNINMIGAGLAAGLSRLSGGWIAKPHLKSQRIREVFSTMTPRDLNNQNNTDTKSHTISTYKALSNMTQKMLELKKLEMDGSLNYKVQNQLKKEVASELLNFIESGSNNDGLRLLNLMLAEIENPAEVSALLEARDNRPGDGTLDQTSAMALELLGSFSKGADRSQVRMVRDAIGFIKSMPNYGLLIRTMNTLNLDEQRAALKGYLNSYIKGEGRTLWGMTFGQIGKLMTRIGVNRGFSGVSNLIHQAQNSSNAIVSDTMRHLVDGNGVDNNKSEYAEVDAISSIQDDEEQAVVVKGKLKDALSFAGKLGEIVNEYIAAKKPNSEAEVREAVRPILNNFKNLLNGDQGAAPLDDNGQPINVLKTLKFVVEVATQEILANANDDIKQYRLSFIPPDQDVEMPTEGEREIVIKKESNNGNDRITVRILDNNNLYTDYDLSSRDNLKNLVNNQITGGVGAPSTADFIENLTGAAGLNHQHGESATLVRKMLNHTLPTDQASRDAIKGLIAQFSSHSAPLLILNKMLNRLTLENQKNTVNQAFADGEPLGEFILDTLSRMMVNQPQFETKVIANNPRPVSESAPNYNIQKMAGFTLKMLETYGSYEDYNLQFLNSDGALPTSGKLSVFIKQQPNDKFLVRIFDEQDKFTDYSELTNELVASIQNKINGNPPPSDLDCIKNLMLNLGHAPGDKTLLVKLLKGQDENNRHLLLELVRNLGSQDDFDAAIEQVKSELSTFLHENLDKLKDDYLLKNLADIGKNIIPHMTDQAILDLLSNIPDEAIEVVRNKISNAMNYVGEPNNNLHTALRDRVIQKQLKIHTDLNGATGTMQDVLQNIFDSSEGEFNEWIQSNHVIGSSKDHLSRMKRRNDQEIQALRSGSSQDQNEYKRRAELPKRITSKVLKVQSELRANVDNLRGMIPAPAGGRTVDHTIPISTLLGVPAHALVNGQYADIDSMDVSSFVAQSGGSNSTAVDGVKKAQNQVISACLELLNVMGVPLNLEENSVDSADGAQAQSGANRPPQADNRIQIQDALTQLKGTLIHYPLAAGVEELVKDKVPETADGLNRSNGDPVTGDAIFVPDRFNMSKKALKAIAEPHAMNAASAADPTASELRQVDNIWSFTLDLANATDETIILNERGQLTNKDGFLLDKDGNLRDTSGRRVDRQGFYLDNDGKRVCKDVFGRDIDGKDGTLLNKGQEKSKNELGDLVDFRGKRINEAGQMIDELIDDDNNLINIANQHVNRYGQVTNAGGTVLSDAENARSVKDKDRNASQIIFNVDGSIIDENGELQPSGSVEAENIIARYNAPGENGQPWLDSHRDAFHKAAIKDVKKLIDKNFDSMVEMLSEHNTVKDLDAFFDKAQLPPSIKNMMQSLIHEILPPDILDSKTGKYVSKSITSYERGLKEKIINAMPESALDELTKQLTNVINYIDPFEELPFFSKFGKTLQASLGEIKVIQDLVSVLTEGYYKEIAHCDKRSIATAVLKVGRPKILDNGEIHPDSLRDLIGAITQAGGPGFQKAMQLFKSDIVIPSIRKALDEMDDSVHPLDESFIRNEIEEHIKELKGPEGQSYRLLTDAEVAEYRNRATDMPHLKRLGSATIAQTHFVYVAIKGTNPPEIKEMVAKVQRPQVRHRIIREMRALRSIGEVESGVEKTLKALEDSILDETDFNRELEFGRLMKGLYTRDNGAFLTGNRKAALAVTNMIGANKTLLLQEFTPGNTLSNHWEDISGVHKREEAVIESIVTVLGKKIPESEPDGPGQYNQIDTRTQLNAVLKSLKTGLGLSNDGVSEGQFTSRIKEVVQQYGGNPGDLKREISLELKNLFNECVDSRYMSDATAEECKGIFKQFDADFEEAVLVEALKTESDVIKDQLTFLNPVTDNLQHLVGQFAAAAFIGDYKGSVSKGLVYQSCGDKGIPDLSKQANNSVCVYKVPADGGYTFTVRSKGESDLDVKTKKVIERDSDTGKLLDLGFNKSGFFNFRDLELEGKINNAIRSELKQSILFKGEGFIDSDRHGGNLLYNKEEEKITCIDTGAGTIITEFERRGMITLAFGLLRGDVGSIMTGLHSMIPSIYEKNNAPGKEGKLVEALYSSINMEDTRKEKVDILHTFLLENSLIAPDYPKSELFDLLGSGDKKVKLNSREFNALDFKRPEKAVPALIEYLKDKGITLGSGNNLEANKKLLIEKMESYDPARVIGERGFIDGENSLLLIKSIRKIANVLNEFNVDAPEPIIQLNRGAKFIDDQAKRANQWKAEAQERLDQYNQAVNDLMSSEQIDELSPTHKKINLSSAQQAALRPIDLGVAYIAGLINTPRKIVALAELPVGNFRNWFRTPVMLEALNPLPFLNRTGKRTDVDMTHLRTLNAAQKEGWMDGMRSRVNTGWNAAGSLLNRHGAWRADSAANFGAPITAAALMWAGTRFL